MKQKGKGSKGRKEGRKEGRTDGRTKGEGEERMEGGREGSNKAGPACLVSDRTSQLVSDHEQNISIM